MWSNPQDWKLHFFAVKYVQSPLPVYIISSKTNDKIVVQEKEIFWMRTKTERENENPASTKIFARIWVQLSEKKISASYFCLEV